MADGNFLNVMTVNNVFAIPGRGVLATGQISDGSFSVGDNIEILRHDGSTRTAVIGGIEQIGKMIQTANKGDRVDVLLKGMSKPESISASKNIYQRPSARVDGLFLFCPPRVVPDTPH